MVIRDMNVPDDELLYIGAKSGSSFFWIGKRKDVPENYLNREVAEVGERDVGYTGTILLLEGKCRDLFNAKEPPSYWFWNDFDKTVPPAPEKWLGGSTCYESLLIALAKEEAKAYKLELNRAIASIHHTLTEEEADDLIEKVRRLYTPSLVFLTDTGVGQYAMGMIEDEARVRATCSKSKWNKLSFDEHVALVRKESKKYRDRRIRESAEGKYASIKGRSVYHE